MAWTQDRITDRDETSPPLRPWPYQFSEYETNEYEDAAAWCVEQFGEPELVFDHHSDEVTFFQKMKMFQDLYDAGTSIRWCRTYWNQIVFRDEVDACAFKIRWC